MGFYPSAPVGWGVETVAPTVFSVLGVIRLWDRGLTLSRMPFCRGEDVDLMATTFCRGESRMGSEILRTELAEGVDCGLERDKKDAFPETHQTARLKADTGR